MIFCSDTCTRMAVDFPAAARKKEFAALTDDEVARIETIYREVFADAGA